MVVVAQLMTGCCLATQGVIYVAKRDAVIGSAFLVIATVMLVLWVLLLRQRSVADVTGLTRYPIRKGVAWVQVDHIVEPTRWDGETVLVLKKGRPFRTGFPPSAAGELAELGGVRVGATPSDP